MREMKDSGVEWLGEVPAGWGLHRAKRLFKLTNDRGNDDLTLLAATQKYGMWPQDRLEGVVRVKDDTDLGKFRTVHKNDFVISLRSFQGGFERSDFEGVCSPAYQTFCATRDIDHQYFKYLFKSPSFIDHMNSLTLGIREGKTIKFDDFATQLLPVPPLDEQRRIADFLDEKCAQIDRAITSAEQSIQEYKAYKSSLISFSLPRKRTLVPIKQLCDLLPGYAFESQKFIKGDDGVRLLRGINVGVGKTQWLDIVSYPTDMLGGLDAYELSSGDLVIGLDRPWIKDGLRTTFITEDDLPCYLVQRVARIRVRGNLYAPYLKHCLDSGLLERHIASGTTGVSVPHISHFQIASCKIPLPPLDEQRRIADFLDEKCAQIDRAVEAKQAIIDELKSYKKSLIYEVVTGKREV